MEIIYNYFPEKKPEPKKENKLFKIIKKIWNNWIVRTVMLLTIAFLMVIFAVIPTAKKNLKIAQECRADFKELVDCAHSDFYSNEYKIVEKQGYMIELFPCGETDNHDRYPVDHNERLIKETWYNNNRTKVENVEYFVLHPQQE